METWILIIAMYGYGGSIASVPGFASLKECQAAAKVLVDNGSTRLNLFCIKQTKAKP